MRNIVWQFRTSFVVTLLSAATFLIFALLANGLTPYYQIFSQQQPLSSSHLHSNLDRHFSWNDQTAQGGSERDETYDLDVVNLDSNLDNIVQNIEEHGDYMKDLKNQLAN